AVDYGWIGQIVLDTRQAVEIVVSEGLGVAARVSRGNCGGGAEVGDRLDVGDGIEDITEIDELRVPCCVLREEMSEAETMVVSVGRANAVAVINLALLAGGE